MLIQGHFWSSISGDYINIQKRNILGEMPIFNVPYLLMTAPDLLLLYILKHCSVELTVGNACSFLQVPYNLKIVECEVPTWLVNAFL